MSKIKKLIIILICILPLSACQTGKKQNVYLQAKSGPQLRMPAGLSTNKISHQYDIAVTHKPSAMPSTVPSGSLSAKLTKSR